MQSVVYYSHTTVILQLRYVNFILTSTVVSNFFSLYTVIFSNLVFVLGPLMEGQLTIKACVYFVKLVLHYSW